MLRRELPNALLLLLTSSALLAQGPETFVRRPVPAITATAAGATWTARDTEPDVTTFVAPAFTATDELRSNPDTKSAQARQRVSFDQQAADGSFWAVGQAWKASFDEQGFTFIPFFGSKAPQNFPLRLELVSASVGAHTLELSNGRPVRTESTVRTARGALTEVIDLDVSCVEQSFVFDTLPSRDAVRVEISIRSELDCAVIPGGLSFSNEHGSVTYTKAIAVDAAGASTPLDIHWNGRSAHIEIPAEFVATAKLPLVLDPVLNNGSLPATSTWTVSEPDIAILQGSSRRLIIWREEFSASDHDVYGSILDANLLPNPYGIVIDATGLDYLSSSVASNEFSQSYMVASEVRDGTLHYIAGRVVSGGGVPGPTFDIERQFVVGGLGNNRTPDIGGDPYAGPSFYCVAFEKQIGAARDIYFKMVRSDGTLLSANPTALDLSVTPESNPSISKSCGPSNQLGTQWLIVWESSSILGAFDFDVRGAMVDYNGTVAAAPFVVSSNVLEETLPVATSPAEIEGANYWMVAFQRAATVGGPSDIFCRMVDRLGGTSVTGALWGDPVSLQVLPDVDTDGNRFALTYSEVAAGPGGFNTRAGTMAFQPTVSNWLFHDAVDLGGSPDFEIRTRICAHRSGGGFTSPRYSIVDINASHNRVGTYEYGGYLSGPAFTIVPTGCGTISINTFGTPALGNTVTIAFNGATNVLFGFPGIVPLGVLGCNCSLGVPNAFVFSNPLVWTVPALPQAVGVPLSAQGFTMSGSQCLSTIDLSDTVTLTIL